MKNIDKLLTEALHFSLRKIMKENNEYDSFSEYLNEFNGVVDNYFQKQEILLNNKKTYYSTIRATLISTHHTLLNIGLDYSLIDKYNEYNDRLTVRYFINGSLNWSDEDFFNAEDIIFNNFEYEELNKLGIELELIDMREKGGECFIELYFDLSSIEDFEISSVEDFDF